jgi:hypothetical protein
MAVALDVAGTQQDNTPGGTSPEVYTGLTTAGSLANGAIVAMVLMGNKTITSGTMTVTWGSQTMTFIPGSQVVSSGGFGIITLWGLVGVTVFGNQNLSVAWTGGTNDNNFSCVACSWTGVNQTGGATSFPNGNTAGATSSSPSVTITSAVGDAVMAAFADLAQSFTATSGTNLFLNSAMTNINTAGLRAAGAASVVCTGTIGASDTWIASGTDIAAAVAASAFGAQVGHSPRGFLPMQKFNWGLRPTRAFPGPPVPPFVPMMLDMSRAGRKQQWISFDNVPLFYATQAPTVTFSMPDMAVKAKAKHWIDQPVVAVTAPTTPTPSTAAFTMPDMSQASRKQQWLDLTFVPTPYPIFYGAPSCPSMSIASKKRQWIDFPGLPLFYPTLAPTPSTWPWQMPDMAVATKKKHWIDAALALVQVTAVVAPPVVVGMPDMAVKTKVRHWLDLFLPIYGPLPRTPAIASFQMPDVSRASRKVQWIDVTSVPQIPQAIMSLGAPAIPARSKASKKQQWIQLTDVPIPPSISLGAPAMVDMCIPSKKQQWIDLIFPVLPPPLARSLGAPAIPARSKASKKQQWLDLSIGLLPITFVGPTTPSNWIFPIPDRSVATRRVQWLDTAEVPPLPVLFLGVGGLLDRAVGTRKRQWIDLSFVPSTTTPVVQPPSLFTLPDVAVSSRKRQWLDLLLPIYGPLPQTPSTAAFALPDMTARTRPQQWLDLFLPLPQFVVGPPTPSFAIPMMMEELPSMRSRKQQWLDLPAVLFYPTLPRTPSSFFDYRWLDMPRPRPFVTEATQGLIGLQTTVPPPVPPAPVYALPRFRRDLWDRDEWGRIRPGSGYHGV